VRRDGVSVAGGQIDEIIGTPVVRLSLVMLSVVCLSSTMTNARKELPCADTSTRSPRSTRGRMSWM